MAEAPRAPARGVAGPPASAERRPGALVVDLVDGTYELFRHFHAPRGDKAPAPQVGDRAAVRGVLGTVLRMLEGGSTHLGVATDHVIESFRNALWPGYKTGEGIDPALADQFVPLEEALAALGVAVWPLVDFEADDGLAAAAAMAAADPAVAQVRIWTPDKDLGQCVRGTRVVQVERRTGKVLDEAAVREKFGVAPASIPDWLALVGDAADGYPGLPGWGARSAAAVLAHFGHLEAIPRQALDWPAALRGAVRSAGTLAATLADRREQAALFKVLATLRTDAPVARDVASLQWRAPSAELAQLANGLGAPGLAARAAALAAARGAG